MPTPTIALLIIDAQHDFCHPDGALYVPGAVDDVLRLASFIARHADQLGHLTVTLDTHPIHAIYHPQFWRDAQGTPPPPFTVITLEDVRSARWQARHHGAEAAQYLTDLAADGQFAHVIWPEHCLEGTRGAALADPLTDALRAWSHRTGRDYQVVAKGTHPLTEHFGVFAAQVPITGAPETQRNRTLIETLSHFDTVLLAGQARSHCVATSLQQAMRFAPHLAAKMVVLTDTMSDVAGMGHLGEPIYAAARQQGIRFAETTAAATFLPGITVGQ